jgi:hypothetical protein
MAEATKRMYPEFVVENNKKPNRFLNFPFLGVFVKFILLIPVFIEMLFLGIAFIFILVFSWFYISFTGKYSEAAYKFFLGFARLSTKVNLYFYGITDKYPGFNFDTKGLFTLNIAKPEKPNRWFAIPLIGMFVRFILMLPYLIYADVLQRGAGFAMFLSWFVILFKGRLPEGLYEFERDSLRVYTASNFYMVGLSDTYPSFHISMNHQTTKILLIIVGAIFSVLNFFSSAMPEENNYQSDSYDYSTEYPSDSEVDLNVETDYNTY